MLVTPARRLLVENCHMSYPFGDSQTRNFIKDCNFQLGSAKSSTKVTLVFGSRCDFIPN